MSEVPTETECWLAVPDHPGYEVSSFGRVRSYRDRQGHARAVPRIMTPGRVRGYRYVKLGRKFQTAVHLLVLTTFIGPCPPDMECRHLDGDRWNARLDNLKWGTKAENYNDRRGHGTSNTGVRHGNAKLDDAAVRVIRSSTEPSAALAERFNVTVSAIEHARRRRTWRHVA